MKKNVKRKFVSASMTLLLLGAIGILVPKFEIPVVQATLMEPLNGDDWTESDNTTISWEKEGAYHEHLEFTSDFSSVGYYSLRVNHTSTSTRIMWKMDFVTPDTKNFSKWDVLVFYIRPDFADGLPKSMSIRVRTDASNYYNGEIDPPNGVWSKCVIPPLVCKETGSPNLANVTDLWFYVQRNVGSEDYSCLYIDGLHFQDFEEPEVDHFANLTFQPNVAAFTCQYGEKRNTVLDSTSYTSLQDFIRVNGSLWRGTIENEALGQIVYALSIAYREAEVIGALEKAKEYGNFLKEFPLSNSYGAPPTMYNNDTKQFTDSSGSPFAGWSLVGLSTLYSITGDTDIKNAAEKLRHFICGPLWNDVADEPYCLFIISTGVASGTGGKSGTKDLLQGLSAYYNYIDKNTTVKSKIDRIWELQGGADYGKYNFGHAEVNAYVGWGCYEAWRALNNVTFYDIWKGRLWLLKAISMMTNGTYWKFNTRFYSDQTWDVGAGWANAQEILHLALIYKNTSDPMVKKLWENLVWDWYKLNRHEPQGGIYFWGNEQQRMWLPSMTMIYAGIAIMQNLEMTDPYPLWANEQYVKTFTSNSTYFTANLNVTNGRNVTIHFYMPYEENLWKYLNCSESSWGYKLDGTTLKVWIVSDGTPITVSWRARDVAVENVTPHEASVYQNGGVPINVTVENQGGYTETFNTTVYYGNATITLGQWETFWSMGDVNRDGYINETDQNILNFAFGSTPGDLNWCPWADLNQDDIVNIDDIMTFTVNYGLEIWTYFISGGVIGTQTVYNLPSGASTTLTFTWNTTGVPYGNYTISAYAVPILCLEEDRADNNYGDGLVLVTIPGDVDADGDTDFADFITFAADYGKDLGEEGYDAVSDLNNDGSINFADFIIFAGNYGKSINLPPPP